MSARPRPVTATVTKPKDNHYIVTSTPKRAVTISPGSSTESLVSVLDHDSYESPLPSEEEAEPVVKNTNKGNNKDKRKKESSVTESKSEADSKETEKAKEKQDDR